MSLCLDLPLDLLSCVLGHVEGPEHLANALLACKTLKRAGEAVPHKSSLLLSLSKVYQTREAGCEGQLLALLTRRARFWKDVTVEVQSLTDMQQLLGSLAPPAGSGLLRLELQFGGSQTLSPSWDWSSPSGNKSQLEECFRLPKELEQLTCLTKLVIQQLPGDCTMPGLPASDLIRLSSLTALQSLVFDGAIDGPLPAEALRSLNQLTSLKWVVSQHPDEDGEEWESEKLPGSQQLSLCTSLRSLCLKGLDPVPALSQEQVLAAWQHLEQLELVFQFPLELPTYPENARFWRALPQLPCLTRLVVNDAHGEPSLVLSRHLPARLASLQLQCYSQRALPPLPPTLTALNIEAFGAFRTLPVSPSLQSLTLYSAARLPHWPDSVSAMAQLTQLRLAGCPLHKLPAPLAGLPALEVLDLSETLLADLPQDLACVGSLRSLDLYNNNISREPAVLGGGAASRLEYLNLAGNVELVVGDDGLAVLHSLTALTWLSLRGAAKGVRGSKTDSSVLHKALKARNLHQDVCH